VGLVTSSFVLARFARWTLGSLGIEVTAMSASLLCCLTGAGSPRATNVNAAEAKRPLSNALIVHPMFVKQLTTKPSSFCPMDWLPDEVITNVLVHLVRCHLA
jgi:hypothetical protein|tara:strand:- start:3019 stop:3324 length:306 start_codon:yes stop_codon:yes gene_type:complete